jgi:hypothetical protein
LTQVLTPDVVCRIENGYCGIKYMQPTSDIYSFTLSGDATIRKHSTANPEQATYLYQSSGKPHFCFQSFSNRLPRGVEQ